jgi:methylenetetrahydrofolate reductase (NADPH)
LIESLQKSGSQLKVIPGILPITNVKQLNRMVELSGTTIPLSIREKIDSIDNPDDVKKYGIEISTKMALDLLNFGAPGIHFYTMNSADSTMAIAKNIGALNEH